MKQEKKLAKLNLMLEMQKAQEEISKEKLMKFQLKPKTFLMIKPKKRKRRKNQLLTGHPRNQRRKRKNQRMKKKSQKSRKQ